VSDPDESGLAGTSAAEAVLASIEELTGTAAGAIAMHQDLTDDLGIDSLELVRLIQIMEDRTGIRLDDSVAAKAKTVSDLVALLEAASGPRS
jgi:acyl carrier protein